jgi:hypothetical protein
VVQVVKPLTGSAQQQLIYLQTHWGSHYTFTPPKHPGGKWTAKARFGDADTLTAVTSGELLRVVREHYSPTPPPR